MRITRGQIAAWLLIAYISSFFFQKISLVTADLGRHVQNGRIILEQGLNSSLINTNFYSYTQSNYPVINHHWLFGIIVHLIHQQTGFSGLTIFNSAIITFSIGLILMLSAQQTRTRWALIAGLIALPLITTRSEVRPETISYLLFSLSIWLLVKYRLQHIKSEWLLIGLSLIQLIWVNTHIFFVFNIGLIGMFWLFEILEYFSRRTAIKSTQLNLRLKTLSWAVVLICGLSFINPAGWKGALVPLQIFDNYGYRVLENQSIPFLINVTKIKIPWYPVVLSGLLFFIITTWLLIQVIEVYLINKKKSDQNFKSILLKVFSFFKSSLSHPLSPLLPIGLIFFIANFMISRLYPFTGLVMIPALSLLLFKLPIQKTIRKITSHALGIMASPLIIMLIIVLCLRSGLFTPDFNRLGLGLPSSHLASLDFFNQHLSGPVFNNYDIGGYLIYGLYPQTKVYVDNRPEAYATSFLTEYTHAQEKSDVWQTLDQKYNFQSIFFYRHDQTTWAQPFLIDRIKDPAWIPVFVDDMVLILVKNNSQNQSLIQKFALPDSIFEITK